MPICMPALPARAAVSPRRPPRAVAQRVVEAASGEPLHPVLEILKRRLERPTKPGRRTDGRKVALCIEGGGMRGAVSAGMVAAIKYCGLENAFDVVYGSSAGAIVGAYFVSKQLPVYGAQIYYDIICSIPENGQRFIDLWALRHHPYFRVRGRKNKEFYANGARPVLLLDRLIDNVMRTQRPLDWDAFWRNHLQMPLKPIASSLSEMQSHTLDDFTSLDEFLERLRASARVPGIAGNPVEINGDYYADGLLFEPIPYRSALRDGCTDMLVLRTKPATALKIPKPGIYEKHIASPYFDRFPVFSPRAKASDYLSSGSHLDIYSEDMHLLNRENDTPYSSSDAAIFSISPPADEPVVGQLESRTKVVYEGVRNGFAAAYDVLSPFADSSIGNTLVETVLSAKGKEIEQRMTAGRRAAKWVFSDSELTDVIKKHREAKKLRAEFRSRHKKQTGRDIPTSRRARMRRVLRRRRIARARLKARANAAAFKAIEGRFFVG